MTTPWQPLKQVETMLRYFQEPAVSHTQSLTGLLSTLMHFILKSMVVTMVSLWARNSPSVKRQNKAVLPTLTSPTRMILQRASSLPTIKFSPIGAKPNKQISQHSPTFSQDGNLRIERILPQQYINMGSSLCDFRGERHEEISLIRKKGDTKRNQQDQHYLHSFVYDSEYSNSQCPTSYFLFELPSYEQVESLMRSEATNKDASKEEKDEIRDIVRSHIEEIKSYIESLTAYRLCKVDQRSPLLEQTDAETRQQIQQSRQCMLTHNCIMLNYHHGQQKAKRIDIRSNVINFELVKIELYDMGEKRQPKTVWNAADYENTHNGEDLRFDLEYEGRLVVQISGEVKENCWRPANIFKKERITIDIDQREMKTQKSKSYSIHEPTLKISSEDYLCTIPCNSQTFKHIFPVMQVANVHKKVSEDEQSTQTQVKGLAYFKAERILDFDEHLDMVMEKLKVRGRSLEGYLEVQMQEGEKFKNSFYKDSFYDNYSGQTFTKRGSLDS